MNSSFSDSPNSIANYYKGIDPQNYPQEIQNQIQSLDKFREQVSKARKLADDAMDGSETLVGYTEKKVFGIKYKSGDTKEIIDSTQDLVKDIAYATAMNAKAQEESFKYQEATNKVMGLLFGMGCANLAANEAVVDEIIAIRDGKSKLGNFKLTDEIKDRIQEVVLRLKQQQDILQRQDRLEEKLRTSIIQTKEDIATALNEAKMFTSIGMKEVNNKTETAISESLNEAKSYIDARVYEIKDEVRNKEERLVKSESGLRKQILISSIVSCVAFVSSLISLLFVFVFK